MRRECPPPPRGCCGPLSVAAKWLHRALPAANRVEACARLYRRQSVTVNAAARNASSLHASRPHGLSRAQLVVWRHNRDRAMGLASLKGFEVLRIRNYRLFWLGQWVSLIGTWMQSVTQAWLLTRITDSPLALGLLGAASSAPLLVLVLLGGLVSDRANRRRVIMVTQALSLVQALLMAVLTLAGVVQPWHIITLAAVLGAINA